MPDVGRRRTPAFEQAAVTELERLQRELEELRQRRQAAADAYDAFLKTFGRPPVEEGPRPTRASREPSEGPRPSRSIPEAAATGAKRTLPVTRDHRASGRRAMLVGGVAAMGLVAVVVFMLRGERGTADDLHAAAPAPVVTGEASPTPAAQPAPPLVEIVTRRVVWVRVTADGERVLERELPADVRVPLDLSGTVVVRAGDAGAVQLLIRGEDQGVLGPDGTVVTRTFTIE